MAEDTLASVGEKVTDVFVHAFATGKPNSSLVFLPFALSTPDDIVQEGVVNQTRLASFLRPNFDAPYLMSPSQYSVNGRDLYYGTASQIYQLAVSTARPTAAVGSDAWTRINSEIATAQGALGPPEVPPQLACVPDDWVLPDSGYWATFDSTQVQAPPGSTAAAPSGNGSPPLQIQRTVNPYLWAIKPAQEQESPVRSLTYLHEVSPAVVNPAAAAATVAHPLAATHNAVLNPMVIKAIGLQSAKPTPTFVANPALLKAVLRVQPQKETITPVWRYPIRFPKPVDSPPPPPPPPPPPTSSMSVFFRYMSANICFEGADGSPAWNGVFLADPNWCVPGMSRGGLLPAPAVAVAEGQDPLIYGIPTDIVVVKDLNISVKWSDQDRESLNGNDFIGPFSLAGASATTAPDGTWNYSRPEMQIVALLCRHLPVLPPADSPDVLPPATTGTSTPSSPADSSPTSPPASDGAGGS